MLEWRIIYPCGNRSQLSCAQVRDYERRDWDIASSQSFPNTDEGERECREHMVHLARRNGLRYDGDSAYLD